MNIDDTEYELHPVSVGNPHAVIFTDEKGLLLPERIGARIEHDLLFPDGVNTEFVRVISEDRIRMRVYERGSGVTMACGTGACASAAASAACGYCSYDKPIAVELDGGILEIIVQRGGTVWMKGPAEFAYEAEVKTEGE